MTSAVYAVMLAFLVFVVFMALMILARVLYDVARMSLWLWQWATGRRRTAGSSG